MAEALGHMSARGGADEIAEGRSARLPRSGSTRNWILARTDARAVYEPGRGGCGAPNAHQTGADAFSSRRRQPRRAQDHRQSLPHPQICIR